MGIELVAEGASRAAFPRAARLTESIVRGARGRGVLVYSGTGNADGVDGDQVIVFLLEVLQSSLGIGHKSSPG